MSYSHSDCVSLESLPVSHTALLFTAFRQRIKEVCHATTELEMVFDFLLYFTETLLWVGHLHSTHSGENH